MPIVIENLTFGYFDRPVLDKVSVTFREGLVHLVLGTTGSGKTTLALAMAGLIQSRQGSVLVDGVNPASRGFDRRTLQLAFQFPEAQMFESTAEKEIDYGLRNFGLSAAETAERRRWAMDCVGLSEALLPRDPACLSFGERRRVALASVIALRPKYLILDEPLAGLDWRGRSHLVGTLLGLKDEGLTTLVLTHESDLVGEIGDAVSVVTGGGVADPVPPEIFLQSPEDCGLLPDYALVLRKIAAGRAGSVARARRVEDAASAILNATGPQ